MFEIKLHVIALANSNIIKKLLTSKEPAVKLKTYIQLLDYNCETEEIVRLTENIKETSTIISSLFSYLPKEGEQSKYHVYTKWQGAHWILASLADICYPPGDSSLIPSRERELEWLLGSERWKKFPIIEDRKRFCASMDGNGLYSILKLKIYDKRVRNIATRLVDHQWTDGGWNCDKKPKVNKSSYHESLIPLRALNLYNEIFNDSRVKIAVDKCAELFLKRKLFRRLSDNEIIKKEWLKLHYPPFWHYDVLMALKVLAEANKITDSRCIEAIDILESKRLPDGGFPVEAKYFQPNNIDKRNFSPANWGGTNKRLMNEFVTIDALYVLSKAKRFDINY